RKAQEAGVDVGEHSNMPLRLKQPHERALALAMLRYPGAINSVAEKLEPHHLCAFAYNLATAFASFYEHCPVLKAESAEVKASRLRLCHLTSQLLADAFTLLGLPLVERM
ncbi:MAG: DALR anticodon-binding domain-containing protein, partial [Phycisphaerales bacterium JB038]